MGLEDYHLIAVWDWKKGKVLASVRGHNDRVSTDEIRNTFPLVLCSLFQERCSRYCTNINYRCILFEVTVSRLEAYNFEDILWPLLSY